MARIGAKKVQWGGVSPDKPLEMTPGPEDAIQARGAADARRPRGTRGAKRIRMTAAGPVRLTPTEARIIEFIARHEGKPCSKAQIAAVLGRNEKTVDRLLSRMRREGIVISTPVHAENGANVYEVVEESQPLD